MQVFVFAVGIANQLIDERVCVSCVYIAIHRLLLSTLSSPLASTQAFTSSLTYIQRTTSDDDAVIASALSSLSPACMHYGVMNVKELNASFVNVVNRQAARVALMNESAHNNDGNE